MNLQRRAVLQGAAGGALLCLAHGPAGAQTTADEQQQQPLRRPPPPRLQVRGAEQPVQLRAVRIEAEIAGRLALTRIEFEFFNPNQRVLEGELEFPLLPGQSIVGMAMEVEGAMREAVPVEKARGEQVFEDVTRARIDPALLSATEGHNHRLRVYPLPAQGRKRVVIRHAETLAARGPRLQYRLPLDFGERVGELSVAIRVDGVASAPAVSARGATPPAFSGSANGQAFDWRIADAAPLPMLEVALDAGSAASVSVGARDGRHYVVAQLPVAVQRRPRVLPKVVALVWDSSGSGADRDHGREFALLDAYFDAVRDTEVRLVRLRDAAEPPQRYAVRGGDWSALRRSLEDTVYDGATNFGALPKMPGAGEWLLFSDGLANYGATPWETPEAPVFAIAAALRSDGARLRGLAERSGGAFIDLLALSPAAARARLLERGTRLLRMTSNAATRLVAESATPDDGWLTLAGELTESAGLLRVALEHPDGTRQDVDLPLAAGDGALAPLAWARLQLAALQADEELNRAEIRRLSQAFGIVTRETSLIILDRAEDYARHDITPPPELAEAVAALRAQAQQQRRREGDAQLDRVAREFARKVQWWEREFPKDTPPPRKQRGPASDAQDSAANGQMLGRLLGALPAAPMEARRAAEASMGAAAMADRQAQAKSAPGSAGQSGPRSVIRLQPAVRDAAWVRRLRDAPAAQLYRVYLDERPGQARSTGFFLDAAELLFERGLKELGLRVLSNLAEMELENRHVLRILANRLLQAGQPRLAVPLLRRVLALAPHEPQSWRDLGLALAADGRPQAAIDTLYEVLLKPWPRFPEVGLITLAELNAIVAAQGRAVDTSRIDRRLLRHLPLDLRAVLSWDADNTDVDLWVTDPNGERCYYGNPLSWQGGRMSQDATGGYGPEEFSLRHAKPGTYRVEAQFYGHRQQIVATATTIQLVLSTAFGTPRQRDQRVTLRLTEPKDRVFVGEFEVG
jgi:Ca-activated chloride channel family protein